MSQIKITLLSSIPQTSSFPAPRTYAQRPQLYTLLTAHPHPPSGQWLGPAGANASCTGVLGSTSSSACSRQALPWA